MQRRKFLRTAGIGGGAAAVASTIAAPAIAQSMPELKWRLASSFPKSLDTLYGAGENFTKFIAEATDNKFQVRIFAAARHNCRNGSTDGQRTWAKSHTAGFV